MAAYAAIALIILTAAVDARTWCADPVLAAIPLGAAVVVGVAARAIPLRLRDAGTIAGTTDAIVADIAFCRAVFRRAAAHAALAGVVAGAQVAVVARCAVDFGGVGALTRCRIAHPGLMALVQRRADDRRVGDAFAVAANLAASTRLTILLRVGVALATCDIAGLAGGAGGLARAWPTVDRLLAGVLDGAAPAGTGLGQRLGLARLRLGFALLLAVAGAMMGLAILAPAVMAVPFALDAAAVLLVWQGFVAGALSLCRAPLASPGLLPVALRRSQFIASQQRYHSAEWQAGQQVQHAATCLSQ